MNEDEAKRNCDGGGWPVTEPCPWVSVALALYWAEHHRCGGTCIRLANRTVWRFVKLHLSCRVSWMICVLGLVTGMSAVARVADANNFTPLSEINTSNVAQLKLVFYFRTGQSGGQSGAPAIVGDLLLLQTAFPHTLYALDIHQPAAPVRWSFTPPSDRRAAGLTCCEASVGGPVAAKEQVVLNTLDGHTVALDGATGQIRWNVKTASLESGETLVTSSSYRRRPDHHRQCGR